MGVNSGTLISGQNINFAVSSKQIHRLYNVAPRIRLRELAILTPSAETWLGNGEGSRPGRSPKTEKVTIKIPFERRFRHSYDIEKEEDEFDKITVLRTEWLPVDHDNKKFMSLGVRVSIIFDDKEVIPLALWEMGVTSRSFQFLGRDDSYELPQGEIERKVERSYTSEVVKGLSGLDVFVKIILNEKVKARVGETEMEFDRRQIECLRELASQIPTGKFFDDKLTIERLTKEEDPTAK